MRSATSVRRLLDAGAIMLGKANLHEFAWGVTSRNRAYGAVVNSARPDRIPGGSSGGNASALAAGLCALGLGTDTGASIRLPAAACGVAGFKPAFGSVPADGLWPLAPSFDHVGPLARSIDDCALAFDVLRGAPLPPVDAGRPARHGALAAADVAATTEAFLEAAGLPAARRLVRLHLAEVAEVHREIYAEPPRRLRRRPAREDRRRLRRVARRARGARRGAARVARGERGRRASGTCSSRPRSPASCRPRTSRPRSS